MGKSKSDWELKLADKQAQSMLARSNPNKRLKKEESTSMMKDQSQTLDDLNNQTSKLPTKEVLESSQGTQDLDQMIE